MNSDRMESNLRAQVIPIVDFSALHRLSEKEEDNIRYRGVCIVKGVFSVEEALLFKERAKEYIKMNPATRGINLIQFLLHFHSRKQDFPPNNLKYSSSVRLSFPSVYLILKTFQIGLLLR